MIFVIKKAPQWVRMVSTFYADLTDLGGYVFDNTRSLLTQVEEMDNRTSKFGFILSNGYQEICETPTTGNHYVIAMKYSNASAMVIALRLGVISASAATIYLRHFGSSTWASSWYSISATAVTSLSLDDVEEPEEY